MIYLSNGYKLTLIKFQERTISCSYKSSTGEVATEELVVHIRLVMDWIEELVSDAGLCPVFKWYPVHKFLVENGEEMPIWDDVDCGSDWWDVQVHFHFIRDVF